MRTFTAAYEVNMDKCPLSVIKLIILKKKNSFRTHPQEALRYNSVNSFRKSSVKKKSAWEGGVVWTECQSSVALIQQGHLEFIHPGTQRLLQLWHVETKLHTELATEYGTIQVVLILEACLY